MVKFTKDGSTATNAAITLARAVTGRDKVAICIDRTIEAVRGALSVYRQAMDAGTDGFLVGRPSKIVYRRYN